MKPKLLLIFYISIITNFSFADLKPEFYIDIANLNDSNKQDVSDLREAFSIDSSSHDSFTYINQDLNKISCKYAFRSKINLDKFYDEVFICKDDNSYLHDILYLAPDTQKSISKKVFLSFIQIGWGISLKDTKDLQIGNFKRKKDFSGTYHSPRTKEGGLLSKKTIGAVDFVYTGNLVIEGDSFKLNPTNIVPAAEIIADSGSKLPIAGDVIEKLPEALTSSKTAVGLAGCVAGGSAGAAAGAVGTAAVVGADLGSMTVIGAATGCAVGMIYGYTISPEMDNKRYCSIYSDIKAENFDLICQSYRLEVQNRESMFDGVLRKPILGSIKEYDSYIVLNFAKEQKNVSFCKSQFDKCDQE